MLTEPQGPAIIHKQYKMKLVMQLIQRHVFALGEHGARAGQSRAATLNTPGALPQLQPCWQSAGLGCGCKKTWEVDG